VALGVPLSMILVGSCQLMVNKGMQSAVLVLLFFTLFRLNSWLL